MVGGSRACQRGGGVVNHGRAGKKAGRKGVSVCGPLNQNPPVQHNYIACAANIIYI